VDAIARAIDVALHLGIPTLCLVSEMNACFQELAHREIHGHVIFSGYATARKVTGRIPAPDGQSLC
jgi:hypothetical protein